MDLLRRHILKAPVGLAMVSATLKSAHAAGFWDALTSTPMDAVTFTNAPDAKASDQLAGATEFALIERYTSTSHRMVYATQDGGLAVATVNPADNSRNVVTFRRGYPPMISIGGSLTRPAIPREAGPAKETAKELIHAYDNDTQRLGAIQPKDTYIPLGQNLWVLSHPIHATFDATDPPRRKGFRTQDLRQLLDLVQ